MATYQDKEQEQTQRVVELYTMSSAGTTYYMTSANEDVTYGGQVYKATAVKRQDVQHETRMTVAHVNLTLYSLTPKIKQYVAAAPSTKTYITIRRVHIDDAALPSFEIFAGYIVNAAFTGVVGQITCASVFGVLKYPVPTIYYQRSCNWDLFDSRCTIARTNSNYHMIGTIAGVSGSWLTVPGASAFGDAFFEGGFVELKPDAVDDGVIDGEVRLIVSQTGDQVQFHFPFTSESDDELLGRYVGVYAGCDKGWGTCKSKFGNGLNFGGFPFIPTRNPATTPQDGTAS